jgi:hypothetical protein
LRLIRILPLMPQIVSLQQSDKVESIYFSLIALAQDFLYSAKSYGKIIISEVYLDDNKKTIRPANLGIHSNTTHTHTHTNSLSLSLSLSLSESVSLLLVYLLWFSILQVGLLEVRNTLCTTSYSSLLLIHKEFMALTIRLLQR